MVRALHHVWRGALGRDPTSFIAAFAAWSLALAVSLLLPGEAFLASPVWIAMRTTPLSEDAWGSLMLADAVALCACLFVPWRQLRSLLSLLSGGFWLFVGLKLLEGGWSVRLFSAGGAFCVTGGVGCLLATAQWIRSPP